MVSSGEARLLDETRTLFNRGQYDQALSRANRALKNTTISAGSPAPPAGGPDGAMTPHGQLLLGYMRAAALTRLSRFEEALGQLDAVAKAELPDELAINVGFTRGYIFYRLGRVDEAAKLVAGLRESVQRMSKMNVLLRHLEAQVHYRAGQYSIAADCYEDILNIYEERASAPTNAPKAAPVATSIWSRKKTSTAVEKTPVTPELPPISAVDRAELLTNAEAAMTLGGKPADAIALSTDPSATAANSFEMLYNAACASLEIEDWQAAKAALQEAENACRARAEADELTSKELDDELATVRVQLAFLEQSDGDRSTAAEAYSNILKERPTDIGAVAVASNNLAFLRAMDPKANLFDLLKRIKATSVEGLEHKLTNRQKRGMGLNRILIMLQMGRIQECKAEVRRLRLEFPTDENLMLAQVAVLISVRDFEGADLVLRDLMKDQTKPSNLVHATYAQVAVAKEDFEQAGIRLKDSPEGLSKKPSTILTVASLFERAGQLEKASKHLNEALRGSAGPFRSKLTQELAALYERHGQHGQAVAALDDLLQQFPEDLDVLAALVSAKSHFDLDAAELDAQELSKLLTDGEDPIDSELLELQQPPQGTESQRSRRVELAKENGTGLASTKKKKTTKSKKKRLPQNYDPNGPPPDPERWLPKKERSTYRKKGKNRRQENVGKGTQGIEGGAAAAAAAEKLNAANPANASSGAAQATVTNEPARPKGSKAKSKRRR